MRDTGWLVIRIVSPSEDAAALLSEGLVASGATAVVEHENTLQTWLPVDDEPDATIARLRERLQPIIDSPIEIDWEIREDEDWLARWKAGLGPRRVGRRLIVTPGWSEVDAGPADIVITIDPQMAFGTGEHASTRGILRLLEDAVEPGTSALDVGTGSAVLAIAAVRLGAAAVLGVESDADALINARENVERNGVGTHVVLAEAHVDSRWLAMRHGTWDLILANVLSGVLRPLLPAFRGALRSNGQLLMAGILDSEADAMRDAAERAGFRFEAEDREEEWWAVRLRRPD